MPRARPSTSTTRQRRWLITGEALVETRRGQEWVPMKGTVTIPREVEHPLPGDYAGQVTRRITGKVLRFRRLAMEPFALSRAQSRAELVAAAEQGQAARSAAHRDRWERTRPRWMGPDWARAFGAVYGSSPPLGPPETLKK